MLGLARKILGLKAFLLLNNIAVQTLKSELFWRYF